MTMILINVSLLCNRRKFRKRSIGGWWCMVSVGAPRLGGHVVI